MIEFKPCPFCGSKNVYVVGDKKFWIACGNCGAEGPIPDGLWLYKGPAITAWNKREQKKGKWIDDGFKEEWWGEQFTCSICGETMIGTSNYCHNCGADMREET